MSTRLPDGWPARCAIVGGIALCAFAASARAQCPGSFALPTSYAVGTFAWDLTSHDFNGDGRQDLAVVNANSHNVSILLGLGGGAFAPAAHNLTGVTPQAVRAADFNDDGIADLVVSNQTSNSVSVLRGNANGTFQPAVNTPIGATPQGLEVGDFNRDGRPDIVVVLAGANAIAVALCAPNGSFLAPTTYPAGFPGTSVAVGDINGDGNLDVAVAASLEDAVSVFLGTPQGTFMPRVTYPVGDQPDYLAVGDVNHDQLADIVVSNFGGSGGISVLLANADGTLRPRVIYMLGSGSGCRWVALGDLDLDGWLDAVATRGSGRDLVVFVNRGNEAPGTFAPPRAYAGNVTQFGLVLADLSGDGLLDVASANATSNSATVFLNQGGFVPPRIVQQPVAPAAVFPGQPLELSLVADGPIAGFRWRRNAVPLADGPRHSGTGSPMLRIDPLQSGDQGGYDCVVTEPSGCTATSSRVDISCLPVITMQPPAFAPLSAGVQIHIGTPPSAPYAFRWRRDGQNLFNVPGVYAGVTTDTLTILSDDPASNGLYDVVITDSCGNATSAASLVTCQPIITQQPPAHVTLVGGGTISAGVLANGASSFQWRRNGDALVDEPGSFEGTTTSTLRILSDDPALTGLFTLEVTNPCGPVTTDPVDVTCGVPAFNAPTQPLRLAPGASLALDVPEGTDYSFQWRQFGQPLPNVPGFLTGTQSRELVFHVLDPSLAGDYDCVVTSLCGERTSVVRRVLCPSDFNADGLVDPDDLGDFINCYFATPPYDGADFNADGDTNADDLGDFINAYFAGCM
ncbi:MAG: FG-GAP-like repeat-containing protein [Phycisphaerales bacterium]